MITNTQQPHKAKFSVKRLTTNVKNYHGQEDVGFEALAAAIVKQAAMDYLAAYLAIKGRKSNSPRTDPHITNAPAIRLEEIRLFFHSPWYGTLCDIDPDRILKRLEAGI